MSPLPQTSKTFAAHKVLCAVPITVSIVTSLIIICIFLSATLITKSEKIFPLPTISQTGDAYPESAFYSFFLVICGVVIFGIIAFRFLVAKSILETNELKLKWLLYILVTVGMPIAGFIACVGLGMQACMPVNVWGDYHNSIAAIFFGSLYVHMLCSSVWDWVLFVFIQPKEERTKVQTGIFIYRVVLLVVMALNLLVGITFFSIKSRNFNVFFSIFAVTEYLYVFLVNLYMATNSLEFFRYQVRVTLHLNEKVEEHHVSTVETAKLL